VAKTHSNLQTVMNMQQASVGKHISELDSAATAPDDTGQALNIVTVYQDALTRYWATELWDRVGQLIGDGGVCTQSWKIGDLKLALALAKAVQAAAVADVLVISVRDAAELPLLLRVWIDAWMPVRAGRPGALVALIGLPAQPDTQSGHAYQYLQAVARRAGLDFLPRERKLPEGRAVSTPPVITPVADLRVSWSQGASRSGAGTYLH
jgi:hypothetical protein